MQQPSSDDTPSAVEVRLDEMSQMRETMRCSVDSWLQMDWEVLQMGEKMLQTGEMMQQMDVEMSQMIVAEQQMG